MGEEGTKKLTQLSPNEAELRDILELFRKQCVNKGGGVGFEETIHRLERYSKAQTLAARIEELAAVKPLYGQYIYRAKTSVGGKWRDVADRLHELEDEVGQLLGQEDGV